ncbi:type IX secretion system membrane protein PorP/SprF [Roseivirga sp. BDSF3-8]|uniref:PorP/SprF family type IX secretion system membrane protein n=1 Tax=Roseivirga sp. BDSF3-8 TaxID=3241598 RepID=UPI0035326909
MKKLACVILLVFLVQSAMAQSAYHLSQYWQVPYLYNPAATGADEMIDFRAGFRQQWSGFDQSPSSFFAGVNLMVDALGNSGGASGGGKFYTGGSSGSLLSGTHGLGVFARRSTMGPFSTTQGLVSYAYHLALDRKFSASLGVAAGISNNGIEQGDVIVREVNDPAYLALMENSGSMSFFDLNAGISVYSTEMYFGYAANQIVKSAISSPEGLEEPEFAIGHYISAGYRAEITPELELLPSTLVRIQTADDVLFDVNLKARWNQMLWGGVSYRHQDAISVMLGIFTKQNFNFGYSYDVVTGNVSDYTNGTHEVTVGYIINKGETRLPLFF